MEEEFITKQLSYLPMDDNLAENEAFKIVKNDFKCNKLKIYLRFSSFIFYIKGNF